MLRNRIWVGFYTLLRRETIRILRIWPQTLLPPVINMALYYLIFGTVIGSRIGQMGSFSYVEYIAPGLVMMGIINNSYMNVAFSFYSNKFQRNLEEMLIAPIPNYVILAGYVGGGIVRGLLVGLLIVLVSLFFTKFGVFHYAATVLVALGTSLLFALAGFINGIFAKSFDDVSIVPMFVLTPLTYLAGVFYSVDLLSPFWRFLTYFNPIFYMVNGFRYGMLGASDVGIFYSLSIIFAAVVTLYLFSIWLLRNGVGVKS